MELETIEIRPELTREQISKVVETLPVRMIGVKATKKRGP
jgi:hypothetical protein